MNMEKLIKILTEETQTLKEQYIEKTIDWAKNYYVIAVERTQWDNHNWCNFFGLTPEIIKTTYPPYIHYSMPKNFFNSRLARDYHKYKDEAYKINRLGKDAYIQNEVNNSIKHYEYSIIKLADRITKKGLDVDKIKIVTSYMGVNINSIITDGVKTVHATTIIASGPIQRPHYRYLVK